MSLFKKRDKMNGGIGRFAPHSPTLSWYPQKPQIFGLVGVLTDLPIALLTETIDRLKQDSSNVKAALWFAQQAQAKIS